MATGHGKRNTVYSLYLEGYRLYNVGANKGWFSTEGGITEAYFLARRRFGRHVTAMEFQADDLRNCRRINVRDFVR